MTAQGQAGYIYALINSTMPGLVKVGRTSRSPDERVAELSSATGVPTPFTLVYDVLVADCVAAEQFLHRLLTDRGHRLTENREFFAAPVRQVVALMQVVQATMPGVSVAAHGWEDQLPSTSVDDSIDEEERDPLFVEAARLCLKRGYGSTSDLVETLRIGYGRSARIIDQLSEVGLLGPPNGGEPRELLMDESEFERLCLP